MRVKSVIVALTYLLVAVIAIFLVFGPGYKWKAWYFRQEWKRIASSDELRTWAMELIHNGTKSEEEYYHRFSRTARTLPNVLLRHSDGAPNAVYIFREGKPERDYVVVSWGGGFGHWGLKIGSEAFVPKSDGSEFYNIPWCPGIYIWHELQ